MRILFTLLLAATATTFAQAQAGAPSASAPSPSYYDNSGHPDNARQVTQLVVDAVDALAAAQPDFPGPTTTSRTRATSTATATCSSPTGSSTTS